MRKLVLKDQDGWLTEVDLKALRTEALTIKKYIENVTENEELVFNYKTRLLPLVLKALNGTLHFPYKGHPYNIRYMMEGIDPELPPELSNAYHAFMLRIHGDIGCSSASIKDFGEYIPGVSEVIIDGQRYEWVDFED